MLIRLSRFSGSRKHFSLRISRAATPKPSSCKLRTRAFYLVNATIYLGSSQLFKIKQLLKLRFDKKISLLQIDLDEFLEHLEELEQNPNQPTRKEMS